MSLLTINRFSYLLSSFRITAGIACQRLNCSTKQTRAEDEDEDEDMPALNMQNPYQKEKRQCILCKYNIHLDYKNARLLSQFVSPFTGYVYDKHITGLCDKQQQILESEIIKSRRNGLMPYMYRDPRFVSDPKLFNPLRPQRPNPH